MPRYYCDYCGTTLTHDSKSVRKAHSVGKSHIRYVIEYYETVAKEDGLFPRDLPSLVDQSTKRSVTLDQSSELVYYNQGAPGFETPKVYGEDNRLVSDDQLHEIPPPATLAGMPLVPQGFYNTYGAEI
ncbi:zf-U1-domain-containing protein [Nadsonia fulvescens var. elongata DSM 6958]|uniref:Zf-U1-domain-containing protein n=1 Tax=Nadsonia fulvescens var. elongata DSM 6958 TaxID=857566 RepID=A0A1E3PSL3_9ASCO|nr:zf-U1-domain-containing protein [Nadsonia fulvescens var. elongata DSM 6958]